MKSFLLIIISFIFLIQLQAQQQEATSYSIVPMQAGTVYLSGRNVAISLCDEIKDILNNPSLYASYYVVFTPIDNAPALSISNKNNKGFVILSAVQPKVRVKAAADYIIYVKRKLIRLSTKKI